MKLPQLSAEEMMIARDLTRHVVERSSLLHTAMMAPRRVAIRIVLNVTCQMLVLLMSFVSDELKLGTEKHVFPMTLKIAFGMIQDELKNPSDPETIEKAGEALRGLSS